MGVRSVWKSPSKEWTPSKLRDGSPGSSTDSSSKKGATREPSGSHNLDLQLESLQWPTRNDSIARRQPPVHSDSSTHGVSTDLAEKWGFDLSAKSSADRNEAFLPGCHRFDDANGSSDAPAAISLEVPSSAEPKQYKLSPALQAAWEAVEKQQKLYDELQKQKKNSDTYGADKGTETQPSPREISLAPRSTIREWTSPPSRKQDAEHFEVFRCAYGADAGSETRPTPRDISQASRSATRECEWASPQSRQQDQWASLQSTQQENRNTHGEDASCGTQPTPREISLVPRSVTQEWASPQNRQHDTEVGKEQGEEVPGLGIIICNKNIPLSVTAVSESVWPGNTARSTNTPTEVGMVQVQRILPNSPASRCDGLAAADEILAVNSICCRGLHWQEVISCTMPVSSPHDHYGKQSAKPVHIISRHCPGTGMSMSAQYTDTLCHASIVPEQDASHSMHSSIISAASQPARTFEQGMDEDILASMVAVEEALFDKVLTPHEKGLTSRPPLPGGSSSQRGGYQTTWRSFPLISYSVRASCFTFHSLALCIEN